MSIAIARKFTGGRRTSELQRQAEDLARKMLGRKPIGRSSPLATPETRDLRRLIMAPEGPSGLKRTPGRAEKDRRKISRTGTQHQPNPKVQTENRSRANMGEAALGSRMPKTVGPEDPLVQKAHEATVNVVAHANAVVEHVKKVDRTITKHGGIPAKHRKKLSRSKPKDCSRFRAMNRRDAVRRDGSQRR